ncbi:MAG TPA: response regulator transcription factor [Clostridia bacterium]|nr:response regulator transcription factor [Clostridia bacterium]
MDKVLVVDDEKDIVQLIKDFLQIYAIEVVEAYSGEEALNKLDETIRLVILDISMEGMSGIETCKKIRERTNIPVIFLTAKNSQSDKVLGLGVGSDDYMTKPFDPIELAARVKANIRRYTDYNEKKASGNCEAMHFGSLTIYPDHYRVLRDSVPVPLTSKEFELLLYLVRNSGLVMTKEQILDKVWGSTTYDYNVVTTNIKRLRRKIEKDPDNPEYIQTVWGVGYVFEGSTS